TAIEEAQERYDGEEPQVRSEHTISEVRAGDTPLGGIPGALTNQPPADGEAPQQIDPLTGEPVGPVPIKHSRENITRNYELDRTISYTRRPQGEIARLSVAVVLDNKRTVDAEGNTVEEPWSDEEIATLTTLVRDAVGFMEERGERVSVLNSAFLLDTQVPESAEVEPVPWWQQPWMQSYLRPLVGLLVILALIF